MTETNIQSGGKKAPLELPPIIEPSHRAGNSKDTRRWCKGRVGVEHELVWQHLFGGELGSHMGRMEYQTKKCLNCGRNAKLRVIRADRPPSSQPENGYDWRYRRQIESAA